MQILPLSDADDMVQQKRTRRDECSAYARHIDKIVFKRWSRNSVPVSKSTIRDFQNGLSHQNSDVKVLQEREKIILPTFNPADYTLFVHGDGVKHWPQFKHGYLNLILASLAVGRLTASFLHLSTPRLVAVRTPCQDHVFEYVMARKREGLLSTYCCAQFLISRETLEAIPPARIERLNQIVDGSIPDLCERIGPSYESYAGERLAYCYSLEFMWHSILTPDGNTTHAGREEEPLRSENPQIPFFLRWKDSESVMPEWKDQNNFHLMRFEYLKS